MATKPKFLIDIEKTIKRSLKKSKDEKKIGKKQPGYRMDIFREAFGNLIENIQTFGPLLGQIKLEYEEYIHYLKTHMKFLQVTNDQLVHEMNRFQEEISSGEEDTETNNCTENIIDRIRVKREKEKMKQIKKHRMHMEEVENCEKKIKDKDEQIEKMQLELKEKDKKYGLLSEEFKSVQSRFAAFKALKDEVTQMFLS